MDETDIHLCPDLESKGLHQVGKQKVISSPGVDEVAYLFGSVNPSTAQGLFEIYDRKRSEEFCLHLEHLTEIFPDHFLFIAVDNAPAHQSKDTKTYLKEMHDSLELVYLPTYSPNLNGIERLWAYLRKQLTRDVVYDDLDSECKVIISWLDSLSDNRIIQTLGVVNKINKSFLEST